ncbi:glycosyl hydrolase [Carboxylicivirga sp. RSCT41]|uniref:glycosyl hydrolase n=1 Tax=Carboxylicivirga agarovorans TaxID=3417570 RepID=UPI003D344D40
MKKLLMIISAVVFLTACEKETPGFDHELPPKEDIPTTVTKKGVCLTTNGFTWSSRVSDLKGHWHYSWGHELKDMEPENIEFVPMFWGRQVSDEKVEYLKQLKAEGKIQYVLGFNEPDGEEQANMTVDEAIALWPKLESIGLPLGSPAPVGGTNEWMNEFMARAKAEGLRIDFVAMHRYPGPNAESFLQKVKEVYEAYGLPIWITEFAVADWNAATVDDNRYTPEQVLAFMKAVLPQLDALDYVERYAWFSGQPDNAALAPSALFDEDNNMTPLGQYYASYTPNEEIGPGIEAPIYDNVEGNLVENGNFGNYNVYGTTDKLSEAEALAKTVGWYGYQFAAEPDDAVEGWACKMLNGWSGDSGLNTKFPVTAGKTLSITYSVKWLGPDGGIKMIIKDHDTNTKLTLPAEAVPVKASETNQWETISYEFTVPDGVSNLRFTFWKGKGTSPCLIDEVIAREK